MRTIYEEKLYLFDCWHYWTKISISSIGVSSFSRAKTPTTLPNMRISISSVVVWFSCLQNHGGLLNSQQGLEPAQPWPSHSGLSSRKLFHHFVLQLHKSDPDWQKEVHHPQIQCKDSNYVLLLKQRSMQMWFLGHPNVTEIPSTYTSSSVRWSRL